MLREIGAVVVGLAAGLIGSVILAPLIWISHPLPEAFDAGPLKPHPEVMAEYFESMPIGAAVLFVFVNVSKFFIGGCIAGLITQKHVKTVVITVALLYIGGGYFDPADIGSPTWLYITFPLYIVAVWLAIMVVSKRNKAIERNKTSTRIQ